MEGRLRIRSQFNPSLEIRAQCLKANGRENMRIRVILFRAEHNKPTAIMSNSVIQPTTLREAWEQGLQQGLIQVALNMVRDGLDLAQIATLTGLPIESVKNLQVVDDPEDSQALVQEFLSLSESSLSKIWLTPEEDEAWKDL
jgi:hypothetical protein